MTPRTMTVGMQDLRHEVQGSLQQSHAKLPAADRIRQDVFQGTEPAHGDSRHARLFGLMACRPV
jgi:hypothetical protein